jgi:hypothetical protein
MYPGSDALDEESRMISLGWLRQVFSESGRLSSQGLAASPLPMLLLFPGVANVTSLVQAIAFFGTASQQLKDRAAP